MSLNEIRNFIFENYYKWIAFSKDNSCYSMKHLRRKDLLLLANKLIEKIADPNNAKEHYQTFIHCEKYRNFTWFPGMKIFRKLCLSTNIPHQEIRWNYSIFCSDKKEKHKINKTIAYQLKNFENPNPVDIKSVITEH